MAMSNQAAHSKLGASSMYRWEACPGSVALCAPLPSKSSVYADEGSRVHELCARALNGEDPFSLPYSEDNGLEELDAVCLYVETIQKDGAARGRLFVEQRLDLSAVYPGCFGTADAILYLPEERLLRVYDFKYGRGVHVAAEDNAQLLYYALGAAITLGLPLARVENVIVQPRCKSKSGAVRRWGVSTIVLLNFWERVVTAARRTADPAAELLPGRHCFFCPGKQICPAHLKSAQEKAKWEFGDL